MKHVCLDNDRRSGIIGDGFQSGIRKGKLTDEFQIDRQLDVLQFLTVLKCILSDALQISREGNILQVGAVIEGIAIYRLYPYIVVSGSRISAFNRLKSVTARESIFLNEFN